MLEVHFAFNTHEIFSEMDVLILFSVTYSGAQK